MLGYGKVDLGGDPRLATREPNIIGGLGSLRAVVNNNPSTYGYLVDASKPITYPQYTGTKTYPSWVTRNDVWVSHWTETSFGGATVESRNGGLTVGFGAQNTMPEGYIGPEYGFGQVVGNALGDQVLLIKTSWGGRSLAADFRPPSSGGTTGPYYKEMVVKVREVLSNLKKYYPAYDGAGYEISGFGWHQGWNDRVNKDYVAQYEVNMVNLIKDLRKEFGVPAMPVVIGNTGMAVASTDTQALALITAQGNVANPSKYPEFAGTVSTVDTRPFYSETNSPAPTVGFHWNYSGESYFRIGESMGTAMVKLLKP
jgi:alpha-galactosidase